MKVRVATNEIRLLLEGEAALCLGLLKGRQIVEVSVGQRLIGEWPEMLSRLQFWGVGGQDEEMDAVGHLDLLPGMPPSAVEHQQDPFRWSDTHVPSKGRQHLAEEDSRDSGQKPPFGLSRRGADEATDVEPLVPLLHRGSRSLPDRCPHSTYERQQTDPMLIGGPELYLCVGMCSLEDGDLVS